MNEVSKLIDRTIIQAEIEDTVTSIRTYAFSRCLELSSVVIPSSVTYIGEWAFENCNGLVAVFCYATTPPALGGSYVFDYTNDCPIYVPAESVNAYKSAWSEYASRIQAMTTDPVWANQSSYCEIGQDGIRTGNKIMIQNDVNPESATYGQTRQSSEQDLQVCYNATYFEKVEDVSEITDGTYILFDDSSQLILNVSLSKDTSSTSNGLNSLNAETGSGYGPWYDNGYVYTTAERGFVYSTATNKATCNIEGTDYTICQYARRNNSTYVGPYFGYSNNVYDSGRIYPYDVNGRIVFGTGNAKIGFDGSNFRWGADTSSMSVYKLVE